MDTPDDTTRTSLLRTALRRLMLGAFICVAAVVVLLLGMVALGVTGLSFDPHGYEVILGIVAAVISAVVAQILWALYRWLR